MEHLMKFNLPEDQQLLQDYQDGIKCKYLLQEFTQKWSKLLRDNPKTKASDMLEILYNNLESENINLFE